MLRDWSRYSPKQIEALAVLDATVPLHETHLRVRYKVRANTIQSLIDLGLIRREFLADPCAGNYSMPFFRLTQAGLKVKKNWMQWNKAVSITLAPSYNKKD